MRGLAGSSGMSNITPGLSKPGLALLVAAAWPPLQMGDPVALAWSRFDAPTGARAQARCVEGSAPFRAGGGYRHPAEFLPVGAVPG